jgi:hypothetical protein
MALRWKLTIPDDNNPHDVVGSLHLHVFARVYRVQSGDDEGRFRWYLNDVPASAGVRLQGIEDTQNKAQQVANVHFQNWLKRAGLMEAPVRGRKQLAVPIHRSSQPGSVKRTQTTTADASPAS